MSYLPIIAYSCLFCLFWLIPAYFGLLLPIPSYFGRKGTTKIPYMKIFCKKNQKNLHISKKSSTFAPAFVKKQHGGLSSVGRASDCGSECRGELKTKTLIRCN